MRNVQRNDKVHQKLRRQDLREAQQAISDLHKLLDQPGKPRPSVGEMVNLAAQMGLLEPQPQKVRIR